VFLYDHLETDLRLLEWIACVVVHGRVLLHKRHDGGGSNSRVTKSRPFGDLMSIRHCVVSCCML
jgi:hypothetical protein